eukprot:3489518-Rhodomonas_salina.1
MEIAAKSNGHSMGNGKATEEQRTQAEPRRQHRKVSGRQSKSNGTTPHHQDRRCMRSKGDSTQHQPVEKRVFGRVGALCKRVLGRVGALAN